MARNQVERAELDRWMRRQAGHGIADEIQRQLTATKRAKTNSITSRQHLRLFGLRANDKA